MARIMVNSVVISSNEEELVNGIKAILNDSKISYVYNKINVNISILNNKIILLRENEEMKLHLEFEKDKKIVTEYVIKKLGVIIKTETRTKKLFIGNNGFEIEYDLFMNNVFSDTFNFKVEWGDL